MFGAACAWKSILSTEYWVHPHCQSVTLTGGEQDIFGSGYSQGQAGRKTIQLQREHLICEQRKCFSTTYYISWPLLSDTLLQCLSLFWHEKNVFPFVLVFRSLQTEWERFPSISSLGWSVGKQYLQSKYLSRLNQSRKTGHTWAVFNGCWVNIISFIGCSKELENHWKHLSRL